MTTFTAILAIFVAYALGFSFVSIQNEVTNAFGTWMRTLSSAANSTDTSFTSDSRFQSACLNSTTVFRRQHNASALTWNTTLATYAQNQSGRCLFKGSGSPFGENIAARQPNVAASIQLWADQAIEFDFNRTEFTVGTSAFTQLVWKSSTQLGCGRTNCAGENAVPGWLVVCEFSPKGNIPGKFRDNVQGQVNTAGKSGVIGEISQGSSSQGAIAEFGNRPSTGEGQIAEGARGGKNAEGVLAKSDGEKVAEEHGWLIVTVACLMMAAFIFLI